MTRGERYHRGQQDKVETMLRGIGYQNLGHQIVLDLRGIHSNRERPNSIPLVAPGYRRLYNSPYSAIVRIVALSRTLQITNLHQGSGFWRGRSGDELAESSQQRGVHQSRCPLRNPVIETTAKAWRLSDQRGRDRRRFLGIAKTGRSRSG